MPLFLTGKELGSLTSSFIVCIGFVLSEVSDVVKFIFCFSAKYTCANKSVARFPGNFTVVWLLIVSFPMSGTRLFQKQVFEDKIDSIKPHSSKDKVGNKIM